MVMELAWRSAQNHSVELAPAIRRLMEQARVAMADVDAVFVSRGPGGFSALRVGISLAKSLAMALEVPLVAVGTLDIEARPYLGLGLPVCAIIEAGRATLYAGTFDAHQSLGRSREADYRVESHEGLVSSTRRRTLFCGEGIRAVAATLRESLADMALVVDVPPPTRRPAVLAELGHSRLAASETDDPEALTPLYMRAAQVQMARRKKKEAR